MSHALPPPNSGNGDDHTPNGEDDQDDDSYSYDFGPNHVLLVLGVLAIGLALVCRQEPVGYLFFLGGAWLLM